MRSKKVTRYWCDHCSKGSLQKNAMATHEKHCTLNPDRSCRVCTLINGGYQIGAERMGELTALLPDPSAFNTGGWSECRCPACSTWLPLAVPCTNQFKKLEAALDAAMPKLREATEDCPACILAALRQKKIPVGMVPGFNFSAEMKNIFANMQPEQGRDF